MNASPGSVHLCVPESVFKTNNILVSLFRLRKWLANILRALPWKFVSESPLPSRESLTFESPPSPRDLEEEYSSSKPVSWLVDELSEYSDVPMDYQAFMESRQMCTLLCDYAQVVLTYDRTRNMTLLGAPHLDNLDVVSIMAVRSKSGRWVRWATVLSDLALV